jgi:hypothetical protein
MFSIRALDSNGQSGKESWDTAIWVVFADYYQTSMAFDTEEEAWEYNRWWNFQNAAHRRTYDSFRNAYQPLNGIIPTGVFYLGDLKSYEDMWGLFNNVNIFFRDPVNESYWYRLYDGDRGVKFSFEAGKPDYFSGANPSNSIQNSEFLSFMKFGEVHPESSITDVQLSDGRIHRVLYMKLPYEIPGNLQYPAGYVRVKYILN